MDENKGSGVTVAVIDTGISQVPDLKDTKFVKGYDFVNDRVEADDDNGHGTRCWYDCPIHQQRLWRGWCLPPA